MSMSDLEIGVGDPQEPHMVIHADLMRAEAEVKWMTPERFDRELNAMLRTSAQRHLDLVVGICLIVIAVFAASCFVAFVRGEPSPLLKIWSYYDPR